MKAEVYSKDPCPHCVRAKALLKRRGVEFTEIDAPTNLAEMNSRVIAATGEAARSVPQIFLDGEYIGGADQLEAHFKKLDLASDLGGFEI